MDSVQKRKFLINNGSIALILLSFVLTFMSPAIFALGAIGSGILSGLFHANPAVGSAYDAINALSDMGADTYTDNSFNIQMTKDILSGINGEMNEALDPDNGVFDLAVGMYGNNGAWVLGHSGIVNRDVFTTFKMIAGLWCMAVALARLIQNIDKGIDPFEAIFKTLVELAIVGIFIMYLERIIGIICGIGIEVIRLVTEGIGGNATYAGAEIANDNAAAEAFLNKITGRETGTQGWRVETTIMLFFPWLLSWLIKIAARVAVYQILIEIGIRRVFTPLAIGDIYQEGLRSPGVRYLKKILAAFFKLAVCVVIGGFAGTLSTTIMAEQTGISYCFGLIVVNLTCVVGMFKAGEYTNDIVGV